MSAAGKRLKICAIIAARNEFPYLKVLLPALAAQDIDVAIIDNESTDGSRELYAQFMGQPVVHVESLPYRGYFSLSEQLAAKQELCKEIECDWIIHHDADEVMEHREPGRSLRDAIEEADRLGYNVINFDEFVFLPKPKADYYGRNYYTEVLRYYFFEPKKNRLNRAWKRTSQVSNTSSGGHQLQGDDLLIAPINHILRHYIVLSEQHAKEKYLTRSFDTIDLTHSWHGNRRSFNERNLTLPEGGDFLFQLESWDSREFCREKPTSQHFWEW